MVYGDYSCERRTTSAGALREWTAAWARIATTPTRSRVWAISPRKATTFTKAVEILQTPDRSRRQRSARVSARRSSADGEQELDGGARRVQGSYNLEHTPDALIGLAAADQQTRNYNEAVADLRSDRQERADAGEGKSGAAVQHGPRRIKARTRRDEGARDVRAVPRLPETRHAGYTEVKGLIDGIDRRGARRRPSRRRNPRPARHRRSNDARRLRRALDAPSGRRSASERPDRVRVAAAELAARGMLDERIDTRARDRSGSRARARPAATSNARNANASARYGRVGDALDRRYRYRSPTSYDGALACRRRRARGARARRRRNGRRSRSFGRPAITPNPRAGWGSACSTTRRSRRAPSLDETGERALVADIDYHHGNGTQALVGGGSSYRVDAREPGVSGDGLGRTTTALPPAARCSTSRLLASGHRDRSVRRDLDAGAALARAAVAPPAIVV